MFTVKAELKQPAARFRQEPIRVMAIHGALRLPEASEKAVEAEAGVMVAAPVAAAGSAVAAAIFKAAAAAQVI